MVYIADELVYLENDTDREIQIIIQTSASRRFVFGLYFPYKTKIIYSPTPVIRTSVIRNLDYPNGVPNVESV